MGWLSPLRSECRDDMGSFPPPYIENEVFKKTPFATLDTTGAGQLMEIAVKKGRSSRPRIKLGI
jgi:pyruvate, orthophosphate dikinase